MNTGLIQTLLESVQALQASVKAIEAKLIPPGTMVVPFPTGAPESGLQAVQLPTAEEPIKKHPLEDYKITEKDIGSLVGVGSYEDVLKGGILKDYRKEETAYPFEDSRWTSWKHAKRGCGRPSN